MADHSETGAERAADAAGRHAEVRGRIVAAAADAGRDPAGVTLVAVSKTFAADAVRPVLEAGQRVFGENRVQEAQVKWPALREAFGGVELHLIGPLQTNKVRDAVALFDAIHTLDRPKLAAALASEIARSGRAPRLFVEVNTGAEPQKAGVLPEEADAFIAACRRDYGLAIAGLMCIPPADEVAAPHFALLAKIAARNGLPALSMGMSADFESAVRLGATHVRVGSAIFGARPPRG
jgi:pyridoxal phosphate enzyme (YggS family)